MLHIEFPDFRIAEVLPVAFQIFLAHLIGIDEVDQSVFHMDVVFKMGEQIRVPGRSISVLPDRLPISSNCMVYFSFAFFIMASSPPNIHRFPMLIQPAVRALRSGVSGKSFSSMVSAMPTAGQKIQHHLG